MRCECGYRTDVTLRDQDMRIMRPRHSANDGPSRVEELVFAMIAAQAPFVDGTKSVVDAAIDIDRMLTEHENMEGK
jgi:hypothetical protein